jgi:hypothetical protein
MNVWEGHGNNDKATLADGRVKASLLPFCLLTKSKFGTVKVKVKGRVR